MAFSLHPFPFSFTSSTTKAATTSLSLRSTFIPSRNCRSATESPVFNWDLCQFQMLVAASVVYFLNLCGDILINRLYRDDVRLVVEEVVVALVVEEVREEGKGRDRNAVKALCHNH
ncbi:AP-2 complex subunit [Arachis hypogaea]|nr:AP-2 complex subunit [Arachis hypogaea]